MCKSIPGMHWKRVSERGAAAPFRTGRDARAAGACGAARAGRGSAARPRRALAAGFLALGAALVLAGCGGGGGGGGVPPTTNLAPQASFYAQPNSVLPNEPITFHPEASKDRDGGSIVRYQWDFRYDGVQMRAPNGTDAFATTNPDPITFAYAFAGVYTVALRVWDDENASETITSKVFVDNGLALKAAPTSIDFDDPAPGAFEVGDYVTAPVYLYNVSSNPIQVTSVTADAPEVQVPSAPAVPSDWSVAPKSYVVLNMGLRNFRTDRVDGKITIKTNHLSDPDIVIDIGGTARSGFARVGDMGTARIFHTATRLPDGTVLIVGGQDPSHQDLDTVEIYHPATHSFTSGSPLPSPRSHHTATALGNGDVLVAGGIGPSGVLDTGTVYRYQTGQWDAEFFLGEPRAQHVAVRMVPAGSTERVVLIGGRGDLSTNDALATAEVLLSNGAPATPPIPLVEGRLNHAAAALDDHRILIAGGNGIQDGATAGAEILNLSTGLSSSTGSLVDARYELTLNRVEASSVLGGIAWLATGGGRVSVGALRTVEAFGDGPATGNFAQTTLLPRTRRRHVAVDLGGDRGLLVLGGVDTSNLAVAQAEIVDPTGATATALADSLNVPRGQGHRATRLSDGSVLITGGVPVGGAGATRAAELYIPAP